MYLDVPTKTDQQWTFDDVYAIFLFSYVVDTHLNCIDKSMQFKWVPTTYAFIKK